MSRVAHPAGPRHADVLPADHPPAPPADLNALHPAIWPRGAQRRGGVLTLGGVDVRDLAAEFGTPVFVTDERTVSPSSGRSVRRSTTSTETPSPSRISAASSA